ncbi:MAG: ABC transporter permease [Planctomycetaceae bacterium]|nr:ABC transporter permease [Planctomycetaceae bacterium]
MNASIASLPATATPPAGPSVLARYLLPVGTLAVRELVRFFRQRTRIVGALGQPILFWILFGAGLSGSFRAPDWVPEGRAMSYQEYFFPGVAVMIVMFTAIFSTISIIEDRREGFLQGVLAAPVPRISIVFGKLCGGAALAVLQAFLFLALGPALSWVGLAPPMETGMTVSSALATGAFLTLLAFCLTALGYLIAWPLDSTQGFHAIMSVFLMPMWLLSGSFFPVASGGWLSWVMRANPLTYGVAGLRRIMSPSISFAEGPGMPALSTCLAVTVLFGVVCIGIDVWLTGRRSAANAR